MSTATPTVTAADIVAGLRGIGVKPDTLAVAHVSLRAFGHVEGGAAAVVAALTEACDTVIMMAASGLFSALPAPPGPQRPDNAYYSAPDWESFDHAVAAATPYRKDLRVDPWLGATCEAIRVTPGAVRGPHPLCSFVAVGAHAEELIAHESHERMLGSLERLVELDGQVLLLGVGHHADTTIHVAEQALGRGCFFRYALDATGCWTELPMISGESHRFDDLEPQLAPYTFETTIGNARVRRIAMRDVIDVTTNAILDDPAVGLCDDEECRCQAALRQYRRRHAAS